MKKNNMIAIMLLAGGVFFSSCNNNKAGFSSGSVSLKNAKDSASYALGIMQGKRFKDNGADTLFNLEVLQSAMLSALKGDSVKMSDMQMQMMINSYIEKEQNKKFEANAKAGEKFLADNKSKSGVKTTASGLQYEVIKEGTGVKPVATDTVEVHYTGTLTNGKKFDSSYDHGKAVKFPLNGVIPAWTEGLQLMTEGSKYKLYVPSSLGYGMQPPPQSGIEPNSVLIFEVELLKVYKGKK
ncbi:FKBP-type peptidyl-prolyl cis-trans isomerase [Cytophagaceae bacterium DM2B3-1]|uniref:Peptidyl-prolyl cis-trans isomerase n=1 Tax=Xanthocytophaga flava TaxID=3048013 RepID=A0ABT7CVK9_9BACT|nr:FKBP-type peptidyl-prolyl cis-trans isomerase [Xanthocytophaga flavus]MDJ1472473.1 FKBP-type peptidyl-prolyl cis-trans isomerase [Xanthocytophaga flavus]MDJ1497805.1 FKBP-type peptidyl-prolyl cis-trans isomerase [Xanthocytophaga flavus]